MVSTARQIHSLNAQAHTFAFDLLFSKLKQKLSNFPKLKVSPFSPLVPSPTSSLPPSLSPFLPPPFSLTSLHSGMGDGSDDSPGEPQGPHR